MAKGPHRATDFMPMLVSFAPHKTLHKISHEMVEGTKILVIKFGLQYEFALKKKRCLLE